ncbi:positive regulation of invadopodium disassembly [Sparganum proliferum]
MERYYPNFYSLASAPSEPLDPRFKRRSWTLGLQAPGPLGLELPQPDPTAGSPYETTVSGHRPPARAQRCSSEAPVSRRVSTFLPDFVGGNERDCQQTSEGVSSLPFRNQDGFSVAPSTLRTPVAVVKPTVSGLLPYVQRYPSQGRLAAPVAIRPSQKHWQRPQPLSRIPKAAPLCPPRKVSLPPAENPNEVTQPRLLQPPLTPVVGSRIPVVIRAVPTSTDVPGYQQLQQPMGSRTAVRGEEEEMQVPRRRHHGDQAALRAASGRRHSLLEYPTRFVDYGLLTPSPLPSVRATTNTVLPHPPDNWSLRRRARRHPELVATEPLGRRRFAPLADCTRQPLNAAMETTDDAQDGCLLPNWSPVPSTPTVTACPTYPWTVACQGKRAYVVSAFEQSLANMAQRLQSLTVSAAQKDSELQELRQLIDSMRQDRANDSAMTTMTSSINAEASPTTCTNFQQHEGSTVGRHRNASPAHSVSIFPTGEVHSKCSDVEESSCSTLPPGALTPGQSAKKANWLRSSLCKAFKKKGSQTSLLLPEPNKSESFRWDGFNSLSRSSQAGGEKLCSPPMDSRFKGSENTPLNGACRMIPVSPSNSSTSSSSWSMQVASGRRSSQPSNVVTKTSSIPEEITRKAILEFKSPDHRYEKNSEKPPRTGATATADRATPGLSALTAEKEIDQLRKELADRETKLTEVQLQALASAHQVDQLRDQMTYMFEELTMLRTENEQLQRLSMQIHSVSGSNKSLPHAEQQLLHLAPATCARNCCANISCGSSSSGGGSSAVPSTTPQLSLNSSSYSHASPDQ